MNLDCGKICRLCLRLCDQCVDLCQANGIKNLSTEIMETIKFCYCIQVDLSGGLPTKVCYECIQVLTLFNITKRNIIASEQLLRNILYIKNNINLKELSGSQNVDVSEQSAFPELPTENSSDSVQIENCSTFTKKIKSTEKPEIQIINVTDIKENITSQEPKWLDVSLDNQLKNDEQKNTVQKNKNKLKVKRSRKRRKKSIIKRLTFIKSKKKKPKLPDQIKEPNKGENCTQNQTSQTEKIVKVIGTVIDQSNILSPDVKRSRKILT